MVDEKSGVHITPNSPADDRIAELHRTATKYKENKEWDKAIECLLESRKIERTMETQYPISHFLRLPLFLQQAGQFSESMREFQQLLDNTENRIAGGYAHQDKTVRKMLIHADFAAIYKSMSTACKREKLLEKVGEYTKKSEEHKTIHAKMLEEDTKRSEREMAAFKQKRANRT